MGTGLSRRGAGSVCGFTSRPQVQRSRWQVLQVQPPLPGPLPWQGRRCQRPLCWRWQRARQRLWPACHQRRPLYRRENP